jgi:UDP-N-acetylmuramate: L-alanyl-gamma-D-glutamyl-meso-diaminopimelate ligase
MGGLAVIAQQAGHRVTGCDANIYPPMSEQLRGIGIDLIEGYGPEQLGLKPDLWVVGNVVTRGNPLMEAILDEGGPFTSGPQWLHDHVLIGKRVLAVAGTHGKTTTSSMLAHILERCRANPGFLIGGLPKDFERSARVTDSPHFVIEADEYDTAFFDKRSKFLHYPARTAVLNNLEFDHADIFEDLAAIERQFHHFVRTIPRAGLIIASGRDPALARVLANGCWTPVEFTGISQGWATGPAAADGSFAIAWAGRELGRLNWSLCGEHNRMNALSAIAAARHAGIDPARAIDALGSFQGVRRRLEVRGVVRGVTLYDDFAHHPTAIRLTIEGLRQRIGTERILAVLEPRSNTMKRGVMKDALPGSLAAADRVFVLVAGLDWDVQTAFASAGAAPPHLAVDLDELVAAIAREAHVGDHIVVMSNGGFGGIHAKLLARLAEGG